MTFKVGDMIKKSDNQYGLVTKEDSEYFWVYWFNDIDCEKNNYMFKYSKISNFKYITKVS